MFEEEDLLPISALQHLLFCERQCALIHIERVWAENRLTVEGQHFHRKAHDESTREQAGVRITRGLALRSFRLGLAGKADVVEFEAGDQGGPPRPYPIEYKRGKAKIHEADRVQLCAQALCLEEMLGAQIREGAVFYGRTRRRLVVPFDRDLRTLTETACVRLHELIGSGRTPTAKREPKCDSCSLVELCMPDALSSNRSASAFLAAALEESLSTEAGDGSAE